MEATSSAASRSALSTSGRSDRGRLAGKRTADDRPGQEVSSIIRQQRVPGPRQPSRAAASYARKGQLAALGFLVIAVPSRASRSRQFRAAFAAGGNRSPDNSRACGGSSQRALANELNRERQLWPGTISVTWK